MLASHVSYPCPVLCCLPTKLTKVKMKRKNLNGRGNCLSTVGWRGLQASRGWWWNLEIHLVQTVLSFPHIWNGCWEENTSVEAEGLFLDRTPILGFIAQNFSLGGQGHICVPRLMTFPYSSLSSLYQNYLQVSTHHTQQFILWINCVVPGNCVEHPVLTICWRSKGLFWTCVSFQEFVCPDH